MKILVISDKESKILWDYFDRSYLEGIDVILSCGDLASEYLSFLATFFKGPVLYVHGNHDESYTEKPPEGCICIEDRVYVYQGVRFLGLGGSMRYKPGPHQYTQNQMKRRAARLWFAIKKAKGFDVLVTHAPAKGLGDGTSLTHTGFEAFRELLERWKPAYMVHGHVHLNYDPLAKRVRQFGETVIVNAYEKTVIEVEGKKNSIQTTPSHEQTRM